MLASRENGFSLIEVLIAAGILVTIIGGVAHLSVITVRANHLSRLATHSCLVASAKMEELLAREWLDLDPTPTGTLDANQTGYHDYVDRTGRVISSAEGASHVRRWAITSVTATVLALEVVVLPWLDDGAADRQASAGAAYVATMKGAVSQ